MIIGILIGVFLAPSFYGSSMMGGSTGFITDGWNMMGMRGGVVGDNVDKHFIEEMIPHHDGAIAMAELALGRSERPEILSLAQGIIEAQTTENDQMRGWYQSWFGAAPPEYSGGMMDGSMKLTTGGMMGHGGMGINMMGMEGDLDALRAAENFDLEFIQQMIPHHEMAIMMARMLAAGTERPEMQTLADQIVTSQSREIELMRGWYRAWAQ